MVLSDFSGQRIQQQKTTKSSAVGRMISLYCWEFTNVSYRSFSYVGAIISERWITTEKPIIVLFFLISQHTYSWQQLFTDTVIYLKSDFVSSFGCHILSLCSESIGYEHAHKFCLKSESVYRWLVSDKHHPLSSWWNLDQMGRSVDAGHFASDWVINRAIIWLNAST